MKNNFLLIFFIFALTDAYRLISFATKQGIAVGSTFLLLLGLFAMAYNAKELKSVLKKRVVLLMLATFLILPLLINAMFSLLGDAQFSETLRDTAIDLTSILIALAMLILACNNAQKMKTAITMSLIIGFLSIFHHQFDLDFYKAIATLSNVQSAYVEYGTINNRFFGLYCDKNRAALSIFLLYVISSLISNSHNNKKAAFINIFLLLITVYGIVLTGSRAAMLSIIIYLFVKNFYLPYGNNQTPSLNRKAGIVIVSVAVLSSFTLFGSDLLRSVDQNELADRIEVLANT